MNGKPSILYLVHRVPYPPNRGDRIRSFHVLEFLAARGDVSLAFLSDRPVASESMAVLGRLCGRVAAVPLGRRSRWISAARSLAVGRTATEGLFRSRKLRKILRSWAEDTRFDLVVVFCSSMVQYLDVPGLAGVPAIVDLVDVDSQKWFEYARHSWGPMRRIFQIEGRRLRRLEASLPDHVEAVTVVSPQEARLFRSFRPSGRVHVIRNGVDLDYFQPNGASGTSASDKCVFVGALNYRANLDGVIWFCREIWPQVHTRHPQAAIRLVGSNPAPAARRLARLPGVHLVGEVPDVRPYLSEAALAVVPLRVARGLQNKVLEAMATGKPVVATPQALEGIGATPGVHVCQAATTDEWVQTISTLLCDPGLRSRLGHAARDFVQRQFQWKTQLEPLVRLPGLHKCFQTPNPKTGERMAV